MNQIHCLQCFKAINTIW